MDGAQALPHGRRPDGRDSGALQACAAVRSAAATLPQVGISHNAHYTSAGLSRARDGARRAELPDELRVMRIM